MSVEALVLEESSQTERLIQILKRVLVYQDGSRVSLFRGVAVEMLQKLEALRELERRADRSPSKLASTSLNIARR